MLPSRNTGNEDWSPVPGWAASGRVLVDKLPAVSSHSLSQRLEPALEQRNYVVHGIALPSDHLGLADPSDKPTWGFMKRKMQKGSPAGLSCRVFTIETLNALARELSAIEELVDNEINVAMGLKSQSEEEPPERPGMQLRPDSMTL